MIKTIFVLAMAIIAGVTAGYSEEMFRAIIATGIVWIHYDMPRR
jgi:hypothetical protein